MLVLTIKTTLTINTPLLVMRELDQIGGAVYRIEGNFCGYKMFVVFAD